MSKITLFTDSRFPCPQRLQLVIHELGLTLEATHNLNIMKAEQKTPSLLKLNPSGSVPFIEDSNVNPPTGLGESRAIARHLATHYSTSTTDSERPKLIPDIKDVAGLAKFEEAAAIEVASFDPAANPLVLEEYFKPVIFKRPTDEHLAQWLRTRLDKTLINIDARLADQPYMAGESLTLVDLFYVPYMYYLVEHVWPSCLDERSHLAAWWDRIKQRDSYKDVISGNKFE